MPILAIDPRQYGLGATNPNPALVSSLASAIQAQEGWSPGSRSQRNNNPGNLMDPGSKLFGLPTDPQGFVIYPDYATGEAALENDLSIKINRGMSISSLLNMYAPASVGNNTPVYIANVSAVTGIDPNTPLNTVEVTDTGPTTTSDVFSLSDSLPTDYTPYVLLGVAGLVLWWMFGE